MSKMIPEDVLESIRSQADIVDVVGQFVQLQKQGRNYFGLCPFHQEKTPSFSVNEAKQIYHCFSCHRGGNVFNFMMELKGLSFVAAVQAVAEMSGTKLPQTYQQQPKVNPERQALLDLYAQAAQLYHHILVNTTTGEQALAYVRGKRQLPDELPATYQIGYAPTKPVLQLFFEQRKVDFQLLRKSGLFIEQADGKLRDRFIGRVMFPIRDQNGQVIAFSGRKLTSDKDVPKYLNSPETSLFNKRRVLFNFDQAKAEIHRTHSAILCEGYMDVLAAVAAGVPNVVASMGTSLTDEQIAQLARHAKTLEICYDGDEPGQNAIKRALELLTANGNFNLNVVTLPAGLDPDEYRRKYGDDRLKQELQRNKQSPLDFYLHYFERNRNLANATQQVAYISDMLGVLARVKDNLTQDLYLNRLVERFKVDKTTLVQQLMALQAETPQRPAQPKDHQPTAVAPPVPDVDTPTYSRVEQAERLLLYRCLHDQRVWLQVLDVPHFCFVHERYQSIYLLAQGYFNAFDEFQAANFIDFVNDPQLKQIVVDLEMSDYGTTSSEQEVMDCIRIIMQESPLQEQLAVVKQKLTAAHRAGDDDQVINLTNQYIELLKKKTTLTTSTD